MTAVIYLRVSTGKQAESGLGAEAQEQACRVYCEQHDLEVRAVHRDDGLSGSLPVDERPGLLDALGELGQGDVLVVAKRDRIARDPLVTMMAEKLATQRGARVVSAGGEGSDLEGPMGVMVRGMMDLFAQFERAQAQMRTRAAMAAKRRRGEYCGGRVPFGWRVDGAALVKDEGEQGTITAARVIRQRGHSLAATGRALDRDGYTNRTGKPWHPQQVARMLKEAT